MRILICGTGSIGKRHAQVIRSLNPYSEIVAWRSGKNDNVCDEGLFSQELYDTESVLAKDFDAVIVCTPSSTHIEYLKLLRNIDAPILLEKTLSIEVEMSKAKDYLFSLARSDNISVGYMYRYDTCALKIKEWLEQGVLGDLIDARFYCGSWLPEWRPMQDYRRSVSCRRSDGGGVLHELSHEIDLALWFLGEFSLDFAKIEQKSDLEVDVEDSVLLVGESKQCSSTSIGLNFCSRPSRRFVSIRGSSGEIYWDMIKSSVCISHANGEEVIVQGNVDRNENYSRQIQGLLDHSSQWQGYGCTVEEAWKVMEVIKCALSSSDDFSGRS